MYSIIKDFGTCGYLESTTIKDLKSLDEHIDKCERENIKYALVKDVTLAEVTEALQNENRL